LSEAPCKPLVFLILQAFAEAIAELFSVAFKRIKLTELCL